MKLVALKTLSNKRPKGAIFEESNPRAKMLVAIGAAELYIELPKPSAKPEPAKPEPPKPAASAAPAQTATPSQAMNRAASAALRRQSNDR